MSAPLDVLDPELDSIVHIVNKAIETTYANSNKNERKSSGNNKSATLLSIESRQTIIKDVTKRLAQYFDHKKINSLEQAFVIQKLVFEQLENLQRHHQNSTQNLSQLKEKNYLKKLFSAILLSLIFKNLANRNLKKLRQEKLQSMIKKWKQKKMKQAEEKAQEENKEPEYKTETQLLAEQKAFEDELRMFFGDLIPKHDKSNILEPLTVQDVLDSIENAENLGDNIHNMVSNLHTDLGLDEHLTNEEKALFKNEIEDFKQHLFEVNTSVAKTPNELQVIADKFETNVLDKLEEWKEKASKRINDNNLAAKEKLEKCFAKITQNLSTWVRGEPVAREEIEQPILQQNALQQPTTVSVAESIEAIRLEAQKAVQTARLAEKNKAPGGAAYQLFKKARIKELIPEKTEEYQEKIKLSDPTAASTTPSSPSRKM